MNSIFNDDKDQAAAADNKTVDSWSDESAVRDDPFITAPYANESADEKMRRSGLAWSAGIVFFSSIAFMLFIGWLADLLLGSSPWGIVGGIVLGSIIGFIQFFRISSQIFASNKSPADARTLLSRDDNDK